MRVSWQRQTEMSRIFFRADSLFAPIMILSGSLKSRIAEPSRRNSGLEITDTSGRSRAASTTLVEPTGTVDLLTTMAPGGNKAAIWEQDYYASVDKGRLNDLVNAGVTITKLDTEKGSIELARV